MKHFQLTRLKPRLLKESNLFVQWGLCLLPFALMLAIRFLTHWLELNHGDVDAAIATAIHAPNRAFLAFDRALEDSFVVGAVSISIGILMTIFRPRKSESLAAD